jgi:streptomycin 6-kinase
VIHRRWGLVNDGSFTQYRRFVEPVRRADGSPAVLRLAPPEELDAAEWFSGHGVVRVLEIDRAAGALLLERALPGTHLRELVPERDEEATAAIASLMQCLWRAPGADCPFPSVRHWGRFLEPGSRAADIYFELCDSMDKVVVLHGDLHHDNVLRSGDGWVAIDSKGVVGEAAYESGALLRNPFPGLLDVPSPRRLARRRIDLLCERLGLDVARVRGWAYSQAVLAAAWAVDDGEDPSFWLAVADVLEPLTREP